MHLGFSNKKKSTDSISCPSVIAFEIGFLNKYMKSIYTQCKIINASQITSHLCQGYTKQLARSAK